MKVISAVYKILLWNTNQNIKRSAGSIGERFINNSRQSCVTNKTFIGNDVSFNGMRVIGGVMFGLQIVSTVQRDVISFLIIMTMILAVRYHMMDIALFPKKWLLKIMYG